MRKRSSIQAWNFTEAIEAMPSVALVLAMVPHQEFTIGLDL